MNVCFFRGKIISNINFKFIINSKNISISIFDCKLENGSVVTSKGYDEIADICYRYLEKDNYVYIYGFINSNGEIEIEKIYF